MRLHWREEAGHYLFEAQRAFSPSMRQQLELRHIYRQAVRELRALADELGEGRPVPATCSLELDDLLSAKCDPAGLLSRLAG